MRKRIVAALLIAAICVLLFVGCSDSGSGGINGGNGSQTGSNESVSVKLLGASWYRNLGYINQTYAVEVTNNNKNKAVNLAQLTVAVKDSDGKIIKVDTSYIGTIAAGDTIRYADYVTFQGGEPSTVSVSASSSYYIDNSNSIYSSDIKASDLNYIDGKYYGRITGNVTNSSNKDSSRVRVSVIFQKGGVVLGGDYDYIYDVNANSSVPFEIEFNKNDFDFDSYEVVAINW